MPHPNWHEIGPNWHRKHVDSRGIGVRFALGFVKAMGSIRFIAIFNVVVVLWVVLNTKWLHVPHWDLYPFILLNLFFSWQASNAASFILIAANDQADRDKAQAEHEYQHQDQELALQTRILYEQNEILNELRNRKG
jgi:uncharacterized membrane protein